MNSLKKIFKGKEEEQQDEYSNLLQTCGIFHLVQILQKYLDRMKLQDKTVELYFNKLKEDDDIIHRLRIAKSKSTKMEITILRSIMDSSGEMDNFVKSIVRIENTFNLLYKPLRKKQQLSRYKYKPTISKYENKDNTEKRPLSKEQSFISLIKNCQSTYLESFRSFINGFENKLNGKYISCSGAKCKGIERAFYKTFYVYNGDYKQMLDMLRCTFVFDTFEDLYDAFAIFDQYTKETCKGNGILRVKDRFEPKTICFGYRDLMINIQCPGNEIITEIQFHHKQFYKYKKESHAMYKIARLFDHDGINDAYNYAQTRIRPNMKHETIINNKHSDKDDEKDENINNYNWDALQTVDDENIKQFTNNTINQFEAMNWNALHVCKYISNLEIYLKDLRQSYKNVANEKVTIEDYRLCGTELDDVDIYKHAQNHTVDTFPYGKRMQLITNPKTQYDFEDNFRIFCKYGLNSLIVDYFDESCKDYTKILNTLFDENENKNKKDGIESIWDRAIINIIIEYLKPKFNIYDLFRCKNRFNETGMTLAAKYGQSASVEIIIHYAKKYKMIYQVINHKAAGGTPLFWLFRCYSDECFEFLDNTQSIRPTMMLLLKNGARVEPQFKYITNMFNVMELAKYKKKKIDAQILETYLKFQLKQTKTAAQYAKTKKNKEVVKILKLYHVD